MLASVVSDGSPGSSFWMLGTAKSWLDAFSAAVAVERVRGRFEGGFVDSTDVETFLCLAPDDACAAESSASSPDASRDEG